MNKNENYFFILLNKKIDKIPLINNKKNLKNTIK